VFGEGGVVVADDGPPAVPVSASGPTWINLVTPRTCLECSCERRGFCLSSYLRFLPSPRWRWSAAAYVRRPERGRVRQQVYGRTCAEASHKLTVLLSTAAGIPSAGERGRYARTPITGAGDRGADTA
jgi:hypothetical protein